VGLDLEGHLLKSYQQGYQLHCPSGKQLEQTVTQGRD
jgi:hypothetical protein